MQDSIENKCEGDPSTDTFCYEFWERVAIDMEDNHLTIADEKAAEFTSKRITRATLCEKCKKLKKEQIWTTK